MTSSATPPLLPFRQRLTVVDRREVCERAKRAHPTYVPAILERGSMDAPVVDKIKYLLPPDLKELRRSMEQEYDAAHRVFQQRRKEVWRTDPEVRRHRDAFARLRRRERRLDAQLEEELSLQLGPEP